MGKILGWILVFLISSGIRVFAGDAGTRSELVGRWALSGRPFCVFKADGTGALNEEAFRWKSDGRVLTLSGQDGENLVPYRLDKGRLYLVFDGMEMELRRTGEGHGPSEPSRRNQASKPRVPASGSERAKPEPAGAKNVSADRLTQLLLSSAWCSFSYNQVSGASQTSRVRFFADGSWARGARGETYSSGRHGTVSGQTDSQDGGNWQVRSGRLYLSHPPETPDLEPLDLRVSYNSNGFPILTVDGKEYSSCD